MKELMNEITSIEAFEKAYTDEGVNVFVFSANWCPDCRFIEPFMPALIKKYEDYHFYYVNRDDHMEICQRLMVMGIPSFIGIKGGKETGRFVSKLRKTEKEIDEFLAGLK